MQRIEMYLRAGSDISVESPYMDSPVTLRKGEMIHTENSHKFTEHRIEELAKEGGFDIARRFTDDDGNFAVYLFRRNRLQHDA